MNTYKNYLESKGYHSKAIPTYQRSVSRFRTWCNTYGTTPEGIDYKTFLHYIEHLRQGNIKARTLKNYVSTLKIYFDYLVSENYRTQHIIKDLHIKGVTRSIKKNYLELEELEDIYYSYPTTKGNELTRKRNKIIIGLLVYQGLNTRDLQLLEVEHLQLYKGTITIPGTRKSNTRELELKPWQLMEFMEYIKEVRPIILAQTHKETEQLLLPMGKSNNLYGVLTKITKELKSINHKFTNIKQLRTSVIISWLQQYNLRKAQYLAGHKYISATECYVQDDLESLHETINTYHPFS